MYDRRFFYGDFPKKINPLVWFSLLSSETRFDYFEKDILLNHCSLGNIHETYTIYFISVLYLLFIFLYLMMTLHIGTYGNLK